MKCEVCPRRARYLVRLKDEDQARPRCGSDITPARELAQVAVKGVVEIERLAERAKEMA